MHALSCVLAFSEMGSRVQLPPLLLLLLLHAFRTGIRGSWVIPPVPVQNDEEALLVPSHRESISDCHLLPPDKYVQYNAFTASAGTPTQLGEFAHTAAIGWTQADGKKIWNCGGSLIWENYVLTAAHCTEFNGKPPDVVRFGDLDLYKDHDNMFTQQINIVEIISHPDHIFTERYHDIALLRLETDASMPDTVVPMMNHDTVVPACLWSSDEIRFKSMQATGWGATGFGGPFTQVLLKVSLRPVGLEACAKHYRNAYRLPVGLHANQMCAGDVRMDTCAGDSGGPLEVKLLLDKRITPFVVGVTSFGLACGLSLPGVYTRVAPYISWIRSVLSERGEYAAEWMFQPRACALRYEQFREVDFSVKHTGVVAPDTIQQVSIHWNGKNSVEQSECYGVIIDESTVVTLARCTAIDGISPAYIRYHLNKTNAVTQSFRHPEYEDNSLYNDIGLLKLKDPLVFSSVFYPACLWAEKNLLTNEIKVSGRGLLELNDESSEENESELSNTVDVLATVSAHHGSNCSTPSLYAARLTKGLTDELLCFGADSFLLPDTCYQTLGGLIHRQVHHGPYSRVYVLALNLFGRDCGYGESAVGVKLAAHMDWMQSVLLPKADEEDPVAPIVFFDSDLKEGNYCEPEDGGEGVCIIASNCPKVLHDFHTKRTVRFCQSESLLCCPLEHIRNETTAEWSEIDECELFSTMFAQEEQSIETLPLLSISWISEGTILECMGTIIASRVIVTAANCFSDRELPDFMWLTQTDLNVFTTEVEEVIVHPEFDRSTGQHNIALVRIETPLQLAPACLWKNTTHTPLLMEQVLIDTTKPNTTEPGSTEAFAIYNTDCERTFGRVLQPAELCVKVNLEVGRLFVDEDTLALWRNGEATYLVGIGSRRSTVDPFFLIIHTRVSSYMSWIKSVL